MARRTGAQGAGCGGECPCCSRAPSHAKPRLKADVKTVPVQTAAPFGSNPGAVTVGYDSVQDDVVVMHDEAGIPTGRRQHLGAGRIPAVRGVSNDARFLAGEGAGFQSRAQLSYRWALPE